MSQELVGYFPLIQVCLTKLPRDAAPASGGVQWQCTWSPWFEALKDPIFFFNDHLININVMLTKYTDSITPVID